MKKKLFKSILIFSFFLITFFSVKHNDIEAASFAYADFNWKSFLEQHKSYWVSFCDEGDEDCYDVVIKTQEKFYTRLYDLLTKYEKKGFKIKDYIIIETVFYGLTPDTFRDAGTKDEEYKGQNIEYGYTIDESEKKEKYLASDDGDRPGAKDYFEKETDSLKTLLNNMIGYSQECYGESNETPHTVTNSDGTTSTVCNGELTPMNGKCVAKMKTLQANFFDSIGLTKLFGNNNKKKCEELTKEYANYLLGDVTPKGVDEDLYWDFLINNNYFDNKFQLQYYFETVISKTNHKKMSELTDEEYEKYNDEIVAARTRIVESIKDIIKSYGEFAETPSSMSNAKTNAYWFPIGGSEITEEDGKKFAIGEPVSTNISSKFGARTDPVNGTQNEIHKGIDIVGTEGTTPVIAAMSGTVVSSAEGGTGSCVNGNIECGGGYGNYIIIQHTDGNYTLYAHMATNSVTVKEGDTVKQGQVIGYVGSTGKSTGGHLHFEVRVGGNDSNSAQDPLKYISVENTRPSGSSSTMVEWIAILEGGNSKGDNYIVEDVGDGVKTFGPGITVEYNGDLIRAHGIDPSTLTYGTLVPKTVALEIYSDVLSSHVDSVKKKLSSAGITVNDDQLTALVSLEYNCGNIKGFVENYQKYGSSDTLCTNWWHTKAITAVNGTRPPGLVKRRRAECNVFVKGEYNMNPYG